MALFDRSCCQRIAIAISIPAPRPQSSHLGCRLSLVSHSIRHLLLARCSVMGDTGRRTMNSEFQGTRRKCWTLPLLGFPAQITSILSPGAANRLLVAVALLSNEENIVPLPRQAGGRAGSRRSQPSQATDSKSCHPSKCLRAEISRKQKCRAKPPCALNCENANDPNPPTDTLRTPLSQAPRHTGLHCAPYSVIDRPQGACATRNRPQP